MPPTFRSSRSGRHLENTNRTRTGQIDHDVFEGLPVRRWTRQPQTVSQAPKPDEAESIFQGLGGKQTLPEHPMPRDSQLLTPTSKALLRAARAGCIYIRQAPKDPEEEVEKETTDAEEPAVVMPKAERNFVAKKWTMVPRHMEPPEIEFLAKRRPGLPSLYGVATTAIDGLGASMRRTRFKKVDPNTGNVSVYDAWVPEGHRIEGEIAPDAQVAPENSEATVILETPAPGTVVEGVGTVNGEGVVVAEAGSASVLTPPKRRPPPPKRKGKGFKGRRKKVMFAPGESGDASSVHGAGAGAANGTVGRDGVKVGDGDASRGDQGGQDGQEDEEDDGEEGEESDEGEESMLDAKTPETPLAQGSTEQTADSAEPARAQDSESQPQQPQMAPQGGEAGKPVDQAPASDTKQPEEKATVEDMQMEDYQPSEPAPDHDMTFESKSDPEAQQPTASEAAPAPDSTKENQDAEQTTAPTESTEKPEEPANQDSMDTSEDNQVPEQEQKQEQEQEQKQEPEAEPMAEGGSTSITAAENKDGDLLGRLEESLDTPAGNEQAPQPEQVKEAAEPPTKKAEEQPSTDQAAEEQPAEQQKEHQVEEQAPEQEREQQKQAEEQQEEKPSVEEPQQKHTEEEQRPTETTTAAPEPAEATEPTQQLEQEDKPAEEQSTEQQPEQQSEDQPQQPADETQPPQPEPEPESQLQPQPAPEKEPSPSTPTGADKDKDNQPTTDEASG